MLHIFVLYMSDGSFLFLSIWLFKYAFYINRYNFLCISKIILLRSLMWSLPETGYFSPQHVIYTHFNTS